jgi:hypothetical protein
MDSLKIINNGTVLFNNEFIMDPWIYGNLYNNAWSPLSKLGYKKKNLKKIKFCFISHLHPDHWDMETIKQFPKDVTFYIPNLTFNKVIQRGLNKNGFKKIKYINYGVFHKISKNYEIAVVPPLNSEALETDIIDKKDDDSVAIDTGLIVKLTKSKKTNLILFDNSPYDIKIYKKYFNKVKINNLFFNYNNMAQDYPLKYNNLSISEKKKISQDMNIKKEKYLIKFINYIKPSVLIPHSSDFILNHSRKLFLKIHNKEFFHKHTYADRISKITGIKTYALYAKDTAYIKKNNFSVDLQTTRKEKEKLSPAVKLKFDTPSTENILTLLNLSLFKCCERLKKYNLQIPEYFLGLNLGNRKFILDFKKKKAIEKNFKKKNILILSTKIKILKLILERKMHINNAEIGCILNWERYPNSYLKFKNLHKSLNFLHI